jgi:MtN3 and saliva related transmembrane protein
MAWQVELLGFIAATLTTGAFAPQVWKSWRTRSVRDLSPLMILAMGTGNMAWLAYGLLTDSMPLIAANVITFSMILTLGAMKLREMRETAREAVPVAAE